MEFIRIINSSFQIVSLFSPFLNHLSATSGKVLIFPEIQQQGLTKASQKYIPAFLLWLTLKALESTRMVSGRVVGDEFVGPSDVGHVVKQLGV